MEIPSTGNPGILNSVTHPTFNLQQGGNLYVPAVSGTEPEFERGYIALRKKEQRFYSDDQLRRLPLVDPGHVHAGEWKLRARSMQMLLRHFERARKGLDILEIGCGNGWLSYHLSRMPGCRVVGLDINLTELQQAARVFNQHPRLKFIFGDLRSGILSGLQFDRVVMAASVQYFHPLGQMIELVFRHLRPGGELHIIDSPFYTSGELAAARQRSREYFREMGFPEMAAHYRHHTLECLGDFSYRFLYKPASLLHRMLYRSLPFPWICLEKNRLT
jgi:SAM-dependent methyltransferase